MRVEFNRSFLKSLDNIDDLKIYDKIKSTIELLEVAENINSIKIAKKLSGFKHFYRIRIGDYRIGLEKINEKHIQLIIVAHRKDIYRLFP